MLRFKLHHLFAISLLVTGLCQYPAQAMGVQFDLASQISVSPSSQDPGDHALKSALLPPKTSELQASREPLPIPKAASQPPINTAQLTALPDNVIAPTRVLTPPPTEALPTSRVLEPQTTLSQNKPIGLSFQDNNPAISTSPPPALTKAPEERALPNWIYEGGSDSLVARVIGSAEGTRTTSGSPTRAYYGHTDPGNGVWNMGTFSYQHGASSPQEADNKQLKRLAVQGKTIANQANRVALTMTLGEMLNGLDLANQSPRAALERGGYVDRLVQARKQGMENSDAIIWARTYSYLNPDTQRWNAPGLGNTLHSIQRDQHRRHDAVAKAYNHYQAHRGNTDAPLDNTFPPADIALADPSLPAGANTLPKDKESTTTKQTPAAPLDFKVAESIALEPNIHQEPNILDTISPNVSNELSQTHTQDTSPKDSSQAQATDDDRKLQIHS